MLNEPLPTPTLGGGNGGSITVSYGHAADEQPAFQLTSVMYGVNKGITVGLEMANAKILRDALTAFIDYHSE